MTFDELFDTDEKRGILKLACEKSLKVFIKVMHKLNTGADFVFKPFHDEIIAALEARANFETTKSLIINVPVGFGKSLLIQYFKSWCFARNKNVTFLYTSYSDTLITKHSSGIKEFMCSEVYNKLWDYKFQKDKNSKANWSIEGAVGRSGLTAGAMGGTITGLDAGNPAIEGFCGAMVIDDPTKATDIIYETTRKDCIHKYTAGLKTRLRRADVPTILIMQRLHEEDLTGYILENEADNFDVITIKALVDEKSIWEEKVSTKSLIECREKTPWVFYAQYQQEPSTNINTSFKGLQFADDEKLIYNGNGHIDKGFEGDDGTAFTIAKNIGENWYVLGKLWEGAHVDDCLGAIEQLRAEYKCGTILTENNDDKGYLAKNNKNISTYHESQNKHFKIMSYLYPAWKNIYFLKGTDEAYIKQIQHYNERAKHDDAPDSLASLIKRTSSITKLVGMRPF